MATLSGKVGLVEYKAGQVAGIRDWTVDVNVNTLDHTVFTTAAPQWRATKAGLSSWSGTANGLFDASSTGQTNMRGVLLTPSTGTIKLYLDQVGGEHLAGDIVISGGSYGANIDGDVTANYSFTGNGSLTFTTTT